MKRRVVDQIQLFLIVCILSIVLLPLPAEFALILHTFKGFNITSLNLQQAMTKLMMKSGMSTGLSVGQGILPPSLQAGMRTINEASNQNPLGSVNSLEVKVPHNSSLGLLTDTNTSSLSSHENETSRTNVSSSNTSYSSRTEKVLSNFLQSPLLKDEGSTANGLVCEDETHYL